MQKLMEKGFICLDDSCQLLLEVRRGMPILSEEGREVGKLAAVVIDEKSDRATHILLCRLPEAPGYWLVPVEHISCVKDESVQLRISRSQAEALLTWHSS